MSPVLPGIRRAGPGPRGFNRQSSGAVSRPSGVIGCLLSLVDRRVADPVRPRVFAAGADELVVGPLLHDVRRPSGNARADEDWRKQVRRNAHEVIHARRKEIGIGECAGVVIDLIATLFLESEETRG